MAIATAVGEEVMGRPGVLVRRWLVAVADSRRVNHNQIGNAATASNPHIPKDQRHPAVAATGAVKAEPILPPTISTVP